MWCKTQYWGLGLENYFIFLIPFASYFDEFFEAVDEFFDKIRNVSEFFEFSKMSR